MLELVYQRFPKILKVGAHIAEHKARIDFQSEERLLPYLSEWQREAQAVIDKHLPIISAFSNEAMERRYWKIQGFSSVPCGGTHLNNTREVSVIALKRVNPGRD